MDRSTLCTVLATCGENELGALKVVMFEDYKDKCKEEQYVKVFPFDDFYYDESSGDDDSDPNCLSKYSPSDHKRMSWKNKWGLKTLYFFMGVYMYCPLIFLFIFPQTLCPREDKYKKIWVEYL
jgi:hypothetical protein